MYHVAEGSFPAEKDVRPGDIDASRGRRRHREREALELATLAGEPIAALVGDAVGDAIEAPRVILEFVTDHAQGVLAVERNLLVRVGDEGGAAESKMRSPRGAQERKPKATLSYATGVQGWPRTAVGVAAAPADVSHSVSDTPSN